MRWLAAVVCLLFANGCTTPAPMRERPGIAYRSIRRTKPRPLRIHVLRIDLDAPGLDLVVVMANDPDGAGAAETVLREPLTQAVAGGVRAGINANAWGTVSVPSKGEQPRFVVGGQANMCGWVVDDGIERSPVERGYWSFWLDTAGRPHIGNISTTQPGARLAVAGFGGLLRDGKVLPPPNDVLHPRTALGLDASGRFLTLVVVDGRRRGFSEGMSKQELAELMRELGCRDALNLDGGGSSVMILRDAAGAPRIVNRPSGAAAGRPIPVLLGVR